MKVGILSDTHNNAANTRRALDAFRARRVERLIHCGDVTNAETVLLFAGWTVTFVWGNMDAYRDELIAATRMIGAAGPQYSATVSAGECLIGVTHGHDYGLLTGLIMAGKYTYVCHGHTHERRDEFRRPYSVRVLNPGALGGSCPQSRSICVLDTDADTADFIEFPNMR
ncbi:YfcE family phosphodiesterase [Aggregatilinea lenta]|uniref:YfcE family phosphodiesterase n=1 Tax=Aggregatilinea lenta TaxID=913108 RepID=UPI0013C3225F|nr:YfcE family phosphodiesterase [Aggregatilinea lenta]